MEVLIDAQISKLTSALPGHPMFPLVSMSAMQLISIDSCPCDGCFPRNHDSVVVVVGHRM